MPCRSDLRVRTTLRCRSGLRLRCQWSLVMVRSSGSWMFFDFLQPTIDCHQLWMSVKNWHHRQWLLVTYYDLLVSCDHIMFTTPVKNLLIYCQLVITRSEHIVLHQSASPDITKPRDLLSTDHDPPMLSQETGWRSWPISWINSSRIRISSKLQHW